MKRKIEERAETAEQLCPEMEPDQTTRFIDNRLDGLRRLARPELLKD